MAREAEEPIQRIHVHLYTRDVEFVRSVYGTQGNIGMNAAFRALVRSGVNALRAKMAEKAQPSAPLREGELESAVRGAGVVGVKGDTA